MLLAAHAVADYLMAKGDKDDYYKINHTSDADYQQLARIITIWVQLQKVDVIDA